MCGTMDVGSITEPYEKKIFYTWNTIKEIHVHMTKSFSNISHFPKHTSISYWISFQFSTKHMKPLCYNLFSSGLCMFYVHILGKWKFCVYVIEYMIFYFSQKIKGHKSTHDSLFQWLTFYEEEEMNRITSGYRVLCWSQV